MARPTTATEICNMALSVLKQEAITSIDPPDDDNPNADTMALFYDQARLDTLESHPWQFARGRTEIAADATDPDFEYDARYLLPTDYVRMVRLGEDWNSPETDYEIEGEYVLCNISTPLQMVYIKDFSDVSKFSPKFVTALVFKLAELAGYKITGSATVVEAMAQRFNDTLAEAQTVAGQNRPTRRIQKSSVRDSRKNLGRYRDWQRWGDS